MKVHGNVSYSCEHCESLNVTLMHFMKMSDTRVNTLSTDQNRKLALKVTLIQFIEMHIQHILVNNVSTNQKIKAVFKDILIQFMKMLGIPVNTAITKQDIITLMSMKSLFSDLIKKQRNKSLMKTGDVLLHLHLPLPWHNHLPPTGTVLLFLLTVPSVKTFVFQPEIWMKHLGTQGEVPGISVKITFCRWDL